MPELGPKGDASFSVLQAVPMSRTAFERKFRSHFGCSPYGEILKVRLQHARQLLTTTRLSVAERRLFLR